MAVVTPESICNRALLRIGHTEAISSLGDEETDGDQTLEAEVGRRCFEQLRDEVLEAFPWPFATRRAVLAEVSGVTRTDYDYVYALPSDCLFARHLTREGNRNAPPDAQWPFHIEAEGEGRVLVTDLEDAELVYTFAQAQLGLWTAAARDGLMLLVASEYALALRKDAQLALALRETAGQALQRAAALSLAQAKRDEPPAPAALRARL